MRVKTAKLPGESRRFSGGDGLAVISDQIQVAIKDSSGRTVRRVTMGRPAVGETHPMWESKDNNDTALPAGIYSFSVDIVTGEGTCP